MQLNKNKIKNTNKYMGYHNGVTWVKYDCLADCNDHKIFLNMWVYRHIQSKHEREAITWERWWYVYTHCTAIKTHIITVPCLLHKGQKCSFKSITNNGNEKGDYSHYNKCSLEVLPFPTVPLENGRVGTKPFGTINPKTAKF